MEMKKEELNEQKIRGGYYSPKIICDFLSRWGINKNTTNILEPSCGDGRIMESVVTRLYDIGADSKLIDANLLGIELIKEEALKASVLLKEFGLSENLIVNDDFFNYMKKNRKKKYDLVIGNPPFIRYQNFPKEHRDIAIELMKDLGLKPNRLTNIWVPFLILSANSLNSNGKLAMVIPSELFQVKYASETRIFLSEYFDRITIITFKKLVFDNIQQEVVLLLCEKSVEKQKGIRVIECKDLKELKKLDFEEINNSKVKNIDHSSDKWTKYFLDNDEIYLLRKLKNDPRILSCKEIFTTEVGMVTGRNNFFILNEKSVLEWNLHDYVLPIVCRSKQLKGIILTDLDFKLNIDEENPVFLFFPPNVDFKELPFVCKKYIEHGEKQGFNLGYKTRIRKRWYIVPGRKNPDAYALRQVDLFPKLILNKDGVDSTDTIHRINFNQTIEKELAVIAFNNSLTYAFSEVTGRSYGGGILTFEPSEISEILIPEFNKLHIDFALVDKLIRERKIEEVLDIVDKSLLIDYHGFSKSEVQKLRSIWRKLSFRRRNRR